MRLLLVEDEPRIAGFLRDGLSAAGFAVAHAPSGLAAIDLLRREEIDLVILDLGLPDVDGTQVLRHLRTGGDGVPVIVLTARAEVEDRVAAFNLGADDFVPKPFAFEELVARVRARLRGRGGEWQGVLTGGGIALDVRTRRARAGGREIELSAREFALLETFLRHPGQVLSREQLLSQVWGYDFAPESNIVEVYVSHLRGKLGSSAIETVRRMGYRLAGAGA